MTSSDQRGNGYGSSDGATPHGGNVRTPTLQPPPAMTLLMLNLHRQRVQECESLLCDSVQQMEQELSASSKDEINQAMLALRTPDSNTLHMTIMLNLKYERRLPWLRHFYNSVQQIDVQFRASSDDEFNQAMRAYRESYFSLGTPDNNTVQAGENGPALTPQLANVNHTLDLQHQQRMTSARLLLNSLKEATLAMVEIAPAA